MEQFYNYIPFAIRSTVADEYLHRIVCAPKKNRSGSTPYANKRKRSERINLKEDDYGTILFYICD